MLKRITLSNIILLFILSSCNIFSEVESEKIDLSYSISLETQRTIIQNMSGVIDYYTIQGSNESETQTISQTISSESGIITNIEEGSWIFIVSAYDSSNNKLASGSGSTIISWSNDNTISIALKLLQES